MNGLVSADELVSALIGELVSGVLDERANDRVS